jgi:hypothetical protein
MAAPTSAVGIAAQESKAKRKVWCELRKEKRPVRVLLTGHPLYLPGEDAPAHGSGRVLGPVPGMPFTTGPTLF